MCLCLILDSWQETCSKLKLRVYLFILGAKTVFSTDKSRFFPNAPLIFVHFDTMHQCNAPLKQAHRTNMSRPQSLPMFYTYGSASLGLPGRSLDVAVTWHPVPKLLLCGLSTMPRSSSSSFRRVLGSAEGRRLYGSLSRSDCRFRSLALARVSGEFPRELLSNDLNQRSGSQNPSDLSSTNNNMS